MPRFGYRRRMKPRRKMGNSVVHLPTTMGTVLTTNNAFVFVLSSPSIFAGGSASSNIEAQDKDRTVNVGHHVGRFQVDIGLRSAVATGLIEVTLIKVERASTTPVLGIHPIPSVTQINTQGSQQAVRLANPGKVFHYSNTPYTVQTTRAKHVSVSPAKYRLSKLKAGDHWLMIIFNRSGNSVTVDVQARYNEYE